jgi:hypothetical protein
VLAQALPPRFPSNSGSRATLTAIRRASSLVSTFACIASASLSREYERLSVGVADDIAARDFVGALGWRKAAGHVLLRGVEDWATPHY